MIDQWLQTARHYWLQRKERERYVLGIAVACIVTYLVYVLCYAPLVASVAEKKIEIQSNKATLAWIPTMRSQLKRLQLQNVDSSDLLAKIHQTLDADRLLKGYPYQLEQTGAGSVSLQFSRVPFNALIQWLHHLEQTDHFEITQFEAIKSKDAGVVKVVLHLQA